MPITVEATHSGSNNNGNNVTISSIVALENDYLLVVGGTSNGSPANANYGPSTGGYTEIATLAGDADGQHGAWYKKMGATPDTSFVGLGHGGANHTAVYIVLVIRGADGTTFLDQTATTNTPPTSDGTPFDGPSITTQTDGALVVSYGYDIHQAGGAVSVTAAPTGYTAFTLETITVNDTWDSTIAAAGKIVASAGAEDPGAFTDDYATANRTEITIAVKPAGAGGGGGSTSPNALRINPAKGNLGVNMTTR